ncbi:MAG TPA: hypothetical protein H9684_10355 [Firmicutes bacterium]|nr:hypothetical protein [Bacillota bacterium]
MARFFQWFGLPGEVVLAGLLLLAAAALAAALRTGDRKLAAAGMLFGALGDAAAVNFAGLGRFLPFSPLLLGFLFYILSRVLYAAAFVALIRRNRYPVYTPPFGAGIVLTLAFLTAAMVAMATGGTFPGAGAALVCVLYAAASGGMLSAAWSYSRSERSVRSAAAAGALALFGVDLAYGLGLLCQVHVADGLIWWVYPFAQLLLLLCV